MSTIPRPNARTASDAQLHGYEAARNVETLTRRLRELADDLDDISARLLRGDGKATYTAAQIVKEFTQQTGNEGTTLLGIIDAAGRADAATHSPTDTQEA